MPALVPEMVLGVSAFEVVPRNGRNEQVLAEIVPATLTLQQLYKEPPEAKKL